MTPEDSPVSKTPPVRKARPEANPGIGASMPQTLLNYAIGTSPIPLQISTAGTITIVADNPGGYSDQPAQDYVTVGTIVFDFGETGAGAPYLTETDGASWDVTSPAGWDPPQVDGLRFTFQPPPNAAEVFANTGLTFEFSSIPIDATVGSVLLTISETSSTPGDPAQPDLYPPIPTQLGVYTTLLGKFPVDFALSPLVATPPNVDAGESSTISWSGAPGANYVLSFGKLTIRQHGNGTKLGADDYYPDTSQGDAPLVLEAETTFTLTVTYTPPGGSDPAILQSQCTVGVNYSNPSVVSFTVTPNFLSGSGSGQGTVLLNWTTENGTASPVSFSVDPPLSDEEVNLNLDNDLFNTSHLATAEAGFTFTQGHRITLQVVGPSGTTPATQTARVLGWAATAIVPTLPGGIGFTRDGKHLLVAGTPLGSGWNIFDVGPGSPATWPVSHLASHYTYSSVATTPDGKYALSVCPIVALGSGPSIAVVEIVPGQPGAAWPQTYLPLALPFEFVPGGDIAVTPDGKYALATMPQGMAVITIPPGAPPSSWTSTLMPGTSPSAQTAVTGQIAISPDGKYAFIVSLTTTLVMAIDSTKTPDQWVTTVLPQTGNDVAITADSQYAIIANATQNSVVAITLASGTSPANWTVTPVALSMPLPARIALAPDGTVAFVAPVKGPVGIIELSGAPSGWTGTTFSQVAAIWPMAIVSPDGHYLLVVNGEALVPFQLTPAVSAPASGITTAPAFRAAVSAAAVDDDTPPLLAYELATTPIPLQVSTPGIITIIASNPGTYSDQPAQDYVAVSSVVLDFGLKGSDAGDLTTVDGSSLTVTPPSGWAAPIVDGLRFTFNPPVAGGNIFSQDGLTFLFANIPVNSVVGTVTLTIAEVASSPGNPAEPDLYPPQPKQSRQQTKGIGKFPTNFSVGDPVARPPNVPVGGGPTLSWNGTAGAAYELDFGRTKVTQHANKTLLQANDLYPNTAAGDAALSLQDATVFTLLVTYTPPGGGTPAIFERQASVGVNYPGPSIDTFTISPPWIPPGQTTPVPVTLAWQTQQGAGEGPVGFALDPPLSAAEVAANAGNNFFNTPHTPEGQGTFNFLQGHRVTLTVVGKAGTTPATQSINFLSFQVLPRFTAGVDIPLEMVFTRDGRYGIMVNVPNDSGPALNVIDRHGGSPTQWTATGLFPDGVLAGVVVTPDDRSIIAADPKSLYVITIDPTTSPANWAVAKLFAPTLALLDEVAISPSGKYLFLGGMEGLFVIDMGPGLPHSKWTPFALAETYVNELLATPDGRYLIAARYTSEGQSSDMIVVQIAEGTRPQTWKISSLAYRDAVPTGVSPDSRYVFVTLSGIGTVAAIDTMASTDPAQWTLAPIVAGKGKGQVAAAVGTPDNQFVFFAQSADTGQKNAAFGIVRIVPGENPSTWPNAVFDSSSPFIQTYYLAGVTPDGRYLLVQYGQDALTPLAVTPPLDAKAPQPTFDFRPRRT